MRCVRSVSLHQRALHGTTYPSSWRFHYFAEERLIRETDLFMYVTTISYKDTLPTTRRSVRYNNKYQCSHFYTYNGVSTETFICAKLTETKEKYNERYQESERHASKTNAVKYPGVLFVYRWRVSAV